MEILKNYFQSVLDSKHERPGRNGSFDSPDASKTKFGNLLTFDLSKGFPATTSKFLPLRSCFDELAWMLRGETNAETLNNPRLWSEHSLTKDLSVKIRLNEIELITAILESPATLKDTSIADISRELFILTLRHTTFEDPEVKAFDEDGVTPLMDANEFYSRSDYKIDEEKLDAKIFDIYGVKTFKETVIYKAGECGPIYGKQWRAFDTIVNDGEGLNRLTTDQLTGLYVGLRDHPYSRQHIVVAWNPGLVPDRSLDLTANIAMGYMGLPPCHFAFQMNVIPNKDGTNTLSSMLYLRSSDAGLGLGFNIAAYAAITHLYAAELGFNVGDLNVAIGDGHIYKSHIEGIKQYINAPTHNLCTFEFDNYEQQRDEFVREVVIRNMENNGKSQEQIDNTLSVMFPPEDATEEVFNTPPHQLGKEMVFEALLDNITADFLLSAIKGYTSEPAIKLDLHK